MTLRHVCDCCKKLISDPNFIELGLRYLKSDGPQEQETAVEIYGDYCRACIQSGGAMLNLMQLFENQRNQI